MGTCKNHPERETGYLCQKHDFYLCEECLRCSDPDIYCKFRSSCVIHFLTRKNGATIDSREVVESKSFKEENV
jgi:hypothetical protein